MLVGVSNVLPIGASAVRNPPSAGAVRLASDQALSEASCDEMPLCLEPRGPDIALNFFSQGPQNQDAFNPGKLPAMFETQRSGPLSPSTVDLFLLLL